MLRLLWFQDQEFPAPCNDELDGIEFQDVGPIGDPKLGYIYKVKDSN